MSKLNKSKLSSKKNQLDISSLPSMAAKEGGAKRAAKFLLALGPSQAAEVLKQLDESEIELIMREMTEIKEINSEEKGTLLQEFGELIQQEDHQLHGGLQIVRQFLEASFSPEVTDSMIQKINSRDLYLDFAFLETIEPQTLASVLNQEHSQVVAVALSYLKPKFAATIMQHLPDPFRSEVAMRIARSAKTHPQAIQKVAHILREKFEKRDTQTYSEIGGTHSLAQILNHMDSTNEKGILDSLGKEKPDMVEEVKEYLYSFEELAALTHEEMSRLISQINDDKVLSTALRGLDQDIRLHFFNAMSQNRAADVLDEMDYHGPVPVREVYEARAQVVHIARVLDEQGEIHIKKDKEKYI